MFEKKQKLITILLSKVIDTLNVTGSWDKYK